VRCRWTSSLAHNFNVWYRLLRGEAMPPGKGLASFSPGLLRIPRVCSPYGHENPLRPRFLERSFSASSSYWASSWAITARSAARSPCGVKPSVRISGAVVNVAARCASEANARARDGARGAALAAESIRMAWMAGLLAAKRSPRYPPGVSEHLGIGGSPVLASLSSPPSPSSTSSTLSSFCRRRLSSSESPSLSAVRSGAFGFEVLLMHITICVLVLGLERPGLVRSLVSACMQSCFS
jgi:hypothetical protein